MKKHIHLFFWLLMMAFYSLIAIEPVLAEEQGYKVYFGEGFSFSLSEKYLQEETKFSDLVLSFRGPKSTLKVYTQKLDDTLTADNYINYGNKQIYEGKAGFKIIEDKAQDMEGYIIRDIAYYRPKFENIENDKNFYREIHVIDKIKEKVITFWAKTDGHNYLPLKHELYKVVRTLENNNNFSKPRSLYKVKSKDIHYKGKNIAIKIPPNKLVWGRFYPGVPFNGQFYDQMVNSEKELGHKFEFIMTYKMFPSQQSFPFEAIKKVYQDNRFLMLTLQPFTQDLNWIAVPEIIDGKHDAKIKEWAEGLRDIKEPIFVRPLNEMNGDWDPWCAWFFGKDTELYIKAWQHIVDIFREVGADNVLFVWNPHDRSYPNFSWNNAHLYYPGDDYVDWVGLTGYNNGTSHPGDIWREFDEIYRPLYLDYLKRYSHKPFMITEFSCNEFGGNKAQWIKKCMESLAKNYSNIKIATWFDGRDKLWLYQLKSSPQAFHAFKVGLQNNNFLTNAVDIRN